MLFSVPVRDWLELTIDVADEEPVTRS